MTKRKHLLIGKFFMIFILLFVVILSGCDLIEEFINDEFSDDYDKLPIEEYYKGAESLTGEELKEFLENLISNNIEGVAYKDAKVALAESDVDPNDDTKVLTIYSRQSVTREWISGNDGWTREHVWPNSRLGLDRVSEYDISQASDLHNLRAIVQSVNSSRGNKFFDKKPTDANSYYPGDEDKGDVARILFYMATRYSFLELVDYDLPEDDTEFTLEGAKMSKLSMLLKWHVEDPVDDFERNRNEVIFRWQKNRNPFIDHPEFAKMIFG